MDMIMKPYFITNDSWFFHDSEEFKYKLTREGKEIPEVVKSYEEFYKELEADLNLIANSSFSIDC